MLAAAPAVASSLWDSTGLSCGVPCCRIAQQEREALEQEAAATSGRISTEEELRKAAAKGSPYTAPGGRWASFRSYSVWQRSFMIWGFALRFFFKLWLVGKKFTYGKKVRSPSSFPRTISRLCAKAAQRPTCATDSYGPASHSLSAFCPLDVSSLPARGCPFAHGLAQCIVVNARAPELHLWQRTCRAATEILMDGRSAGND